jgi:leucyl/phenylalanyl-tRNA--protein transferase
VSGIPLLPVHPIRFPEPCHALDDPDGLLAAGGALTVEWLLEAYGRGIFPWFENDEGPIYWWCPTVRGVTIPGEMRITRSLAKRLRNGGFTVTFDRCFDEVIEACAKLRASSVGTWITPKMRQAYRELHATGVAHSVEVWWEDTLVGGLYGLALGHMFFGESMFAQRPDASKVAFYHLHQQLQAWNFSLIDCQMMNPHLESMGVVPMPREKFLALLEKNDLSQSRLGPWDRSAATTSSECKL